LVWAGHEAGTQSEWTGDGGGGEYNSGTGNSAVSTAFARTGKYSLKTIYKYNKRGFSWTRNFSGKKSEVTQILFSHNMSISRLK